jgi:hypothetical protein
MCGGEVCLSFHLGLVGNVLIRTAFDFEEKVEETKWSTHPKIVKANDTTEI